MNTTLNTNAFSGIGLELAKQFASDGDNVVVIPADLAEPDGVDRRCAQLLQRSIQVDTLVSNAGFGALVGDQGYRDNKDVILPG